MKKSIVLLIALSFVSIAYAASTLSILDRIADNASIANGDANTGYYDVDKFSVGKEIYLIKQSFDEEDDCKYKIKVGRRFALKLVEEYEDGYASHDLDVVKELKELYAQRKFKTAISTYWDGESGDSEYCDRAMIDFYTKDGYHLVLDYDVTD
jgi:hypothetical protein